MPKEKSEEKHSHVHQLHSLKEKKQNRFLIIGFVTTAVLIAGLIGYALLYESFFKERIPVAKVNDAAIDNEYFKERVRLERNSYVQQYQLINVQAQFVFEDENAQAYYQQQLGQIQQMLDDHVNFGKQVLDRIIDDEILAQQAESMNIVVSDLEVEKELQSLFDFYPNGTPTPQPTSLPYATPTISSKQKELLKYTPTPKIDPISETSESEELNEENDSVESTATAAATEATPSPTATVYTEELYKENYQTYIRTMEDINVTEKYLRIYMYHYLIDKKVMEEVTKDISREQEQVWARHILVETQDEALKIIERLKSGEDWAEIAATESLDTGTKDNGGDLGWFSRGRMVEPFENAAFALKDGEISEPVESDFGWHIIQAIGHDISPLPDSDFESLKDVKFNQWFTEIKEQADIKINDVYKDLTPADPAIPEEYRIP